MLWCLSEARSVTQFAWTPGFFLVIQSFLQNSCTQGFPSEAEACASDLFAGELSGYKGCVSVLREALSH